MSKKYLDMGGNDSNGDPKVRVRYRIGTLPERSKNDADESLTFHNIASSEYTDRGEAIAQLQAERHGSASSSYGQQYSHKDDTSRLVLVKTVQTIEPIEVSELSPVELVSATKNTTCDLCGERIVKGRPMGVIVRGTENVDLVCERCAIDLLIRTRLENTMHKPKMDQDHE